jgi:hypothetical protein
MSDSVKFCPQCGSAAVNFSALAGGDAECRGCRWQGKVEEVLSLPILKDSPLAGEDTAIQGMVKDLRALLSGSLGLPYLKFLVKWGFLKCDLERVADTIDRKQFARYLVAIAKGVITAVMAERTRAEEAKAVALAAPSAGAN